MVDVICEVTSGKVFSPGGGRLLMNDVRKS